MEQDINFLLEKQTAEIKKYNNALKEGFDSKIDKTERHFDLLKEDFDSKVKLLTEQYSSIKETLNSHDEKFSSIEENIEIMKVDVAFIKSGIKKKVDIEEFEALEKRVIILEAKRDLIPA